MQNTGLGLLETTMLTGCNPPSTAFGRSLAFQTPRPYREWLEEATRSGGGVCGASGWKRTLRLATDVETLDPNRPGVSYLNILALIRHHPSLCAAASGCM